LSVGLLKLFAWTTDFNPNIQKNTYVQVWLKICHLRKSIGRPVLFSIASSFGSSLRIDYVTDKFMFERTFGHFVRVLVGIDLAGILRHKVLVERKGFAFFLDSEYENLLDFCNLFQFYWPPCWNM